MQLDCPHCRSTIWVTGPVGPETVCRTCGATVLLGGDRRSASGTAETSTEQLDFASKSDPGLGGSGDTLLFRELPIPGASDATPRLDETTVGVAMAVGGATQSLRHFGDYELLGEIARGGMGIVYRARQKSLNRVVAVKMILGGRLASTADVQRFRTEAEAAANLHHPHIVAIHEVGDHESLHYFSMDYVDGTSLAALVSHNPLPVRRAAAYARKIADAVHYAHQCGILHRDLKPSNILVDRGDEPRITDFGLAKRLEDGSKLTASGAVLGTPSYMPPEQAEGRHDRVGPAADVYSVGAILYELVTGRPPFRAESPVETLRQVLDAEPAPPSLLNERVDRDLETICLKCLQKEPSRRYPSARDLADDLARFLAGEPIHARPVGAFERAWRWCRRNPRMALLAAAVLLLLVTIAGGSTAAALVIAHQQRQTEAARQAATNNFIEASNERARAEANFAKARDAVNQMLTRVANDVLLELPQTEPVRRALLEDALKFYEGFLEQRSSDPDVLHETALAQFHVAEISRMLGDESTAGNAYSEAARLLEELSKRFPAQPIYSHDLANVHNWHGELLRNFGHLPQAESAYRNAITLLESLVNSHPHEPSYATMLARSLYNLGIACKSMSRLDESAAANDTAAQLLRQLSLEHPDSPQFRFDLARCLINRGVILKDRGEFAAAETAYAEANQYLQQLVDEYPANREYRLTLGACGNNMGNALLLTRDRTRYGDAATQYRQALAMFEKLVNDSPAVPLYRRELANCCNSLALILQRLEQPDEAQKVWERGLQIAETLVADYGAVPDYRQTLGGILANLALRIMDRGDVETARSMLQRAVHEEQIAFDANPENPSYRHFLRTDYGRLARAAARLGDHVQAAEAIQKSQALGFANPQDYVRAAAVMAECVQCARSDEQLDEARRRELIDRYGDYALTLLDDAIEQGYRDAQGLQNDPALEPIRTRPDFSALLAKLQAKLDHHHPPP